MSNVILIVEDEQLELDFLKGLVSDEIHKDDKVYTCETGTEAINFAKRYKPNIILLDISIPEIDGLSALKEIRKFLPNACVLILSAYSEFVYAQSAIELKVLSYLLKPIRPNEFRKAFHNALSSVSNVVPLPMEDTAVETPIDKQYFIEESLKYIHENYKEKLTLEMASSHIFMNPQYFSRVFKKEMGVTYTKYVNNLKILYACKLLETTNYPAYRISLECGFTDASYFNRVFFNQMKMTPIEYKKYIRVSKNKFKENC